LKEAFDQIVYPSINNELRATGIDFNFAGNQNGEATIRHTLEGVQKFTTKINEDSFRQRAESRLFGSAASISVLWSDFKRAAAVSTNWPLHKLSALDDLKEDCLRRGLWREEGNHIRRGPFPPPTPEVSIRELSVQDDGDGRAYLKIEPLHATAVVFETGDSDPTSASSPVPTPKRFEATGLQYRFLAFDPENTKRVSAVKDWTAKIRLKYQLHNRGNHYEAELLALPKANGIVIRYTTDGSSPTIASAATYDGLFRVPTNCRVVCAQASSAAYNLSSDCIRVQIPQPGQKIDNQIDLTRPARWNKLVKLDDAGTVWDFLERLGLAEGVVAHDIGFTAESADGSQHLEYSGALENGYDSTLAKMVAERLQQIVSSGSLRMTVGSLAFPTGQALLDWLRATNQQFDAAKANQ